ncbi:C-terminal binding protein [Nesterenkonia sandarakina]|uniref:D-3-phosphoglycerate dehydrogenase n=1 Tax=Nesterenkonia sandarakina TaxID=272918 RepID=A0A7Z0EAR7_9MICC|nr:C-terminal binding protein [Nesterenkonia sandarakina]NYJ18103.1 D-3-phosphoglycerate dehydrogenase [Nesterenkonia sandarakina]
MRVVVTDHEFPHLTAEQEATTARGAGFSVHNTRDEDEVVSITEGADVVLLAFAPITERVLRGLAKNATVIRYGVGYDTIDVEAATRHGVRVCNIPDYGSDTVADHTVMLALTVLRRTLEYDQTLRGPSNGWISAREIGEIPALSDVTFGLIGTGTIGRLVASRMSSFGAKLIAYDPYADAHTLEQHGIEQVGFDHLLEEANILSLHAPLTPETHHILDETALRRTNPGTIVINTARGPLLDTLAAAALTESGHLGGLGLDVFEEEPLAANHPVRQAPRTVLTPHAAFYSAQSLRNMQDYAAAEINRALSGQPLRCQVNR